MSEIGRKIVAASEFINVLTTGNGYSSNFTLDEAEHFTKHWSVIDQVETNTGFSGALFKCVISDPATWALKNELVMSFFAARNSLRTPCVTISPQMNWKSRKPAGPGASCATWMRAHKAAQRSFFAGRKRVFRHGIQSRRPSCHRVQPHACRGSDKGRDL